MNKCLEEMEKLKNDAPPNFVMSQFTTLICITLKWHSTTDHSINVFLKLSITSDVIGFSETRLTNEDVAENYQLLGYSQYLTTRKQRH